MEQNPKNWHSIYVSRSQFIGYNGPCIGKVREFRPAFQSAVEKLKLNKKCQITAELFSRLKGVNPHFLMQ